MLQFSELSKRNKGPFFSQVDVFFNAFTLSPLNGVSSRFFLNHIDKWKLIYEFQHIQKNNVEWNIFMALEHELKDKS